MKISICIPQYNRIKFLISSLQTISEQDYDNIEIVISDDCSSDDTVEQIAILKKTYRYPIVFSRNEPNLGYDRNLRKSMELASGDYLFVIGNDDTLFFNDSISKLVAFLEANDLPSVGYCNFVEFRDQKTIIRRAVKTAVLGIGEQVAKENYSSFTFVGGLIFKRDWFEKVNTSEFDGSIFVQIYMILRIVLQGGQLFSIAEPLVLKDIFIDGKFRNSYRDRLQRRWKDYQELDGGLFNVGKVISRAFKDSGSKINIDYYYLRRVYLYTYPHWILDYKSNKALVAATGLVVGLNPLKTPLFRNLNLFHKIIVYGVYLISTLFALLTPSFIFMKLKNSIYNFKKKFLR
jgi:glycosyltransferase involved in cell wall biosynthesis